MPLTSRSKTSPIGRTAREAAGDRYAHDAEYRKQHDANAPYREIARAVIYARADLDLSQADLAKRIGTTDSVISRIESGNYPIGLTTLRKLGPALNLTFVIGDIKEIQVLPKNAQVVVVPPLAIELELVEVPVRRAVAASGFRSALPHGAYALSMKTVRSSTAAAKRTSKSR